MRWVNYDRILVFGWIVTLKQLSANFFPLFVYHGNTESLIPFLKLMEFIKYFHIDAALPACNNDHQYIFINLLWNRTKINLALQLVQGRATTAIYNSR